MKKIMREHMRERFGVVNERSLYPPFPKSLNIELNNTCNQKCFFCPYHGEFAMNPSKPAVLELSFVKELLDRAYALGIGQKEVGFYITGEAFLYKHLPEVIKYAKNLGYEYTFITTNGALATPEKMEAVVEAGLDSIRFSVNAADRELYKFVHKSDDFDAVLNNMEKLYDYREKNNINIAISLSCVVTKKTMSVMNDIKDVFGGFVDDILYIPVIFSGLNNSQELKRDYQLIDDSEAIDYNYICPLIFDTMYINAHGQVIPCCEAYRGNVYFADLYEDMDLEKAWHSEGYLKYRSVFINNESDSGTICKNCLLRTKGVNRLSMDDFL